MKTRFELIIFDWDGTLSDSVGLITDLMIQSFVLHNVEPPSRREVADILGIKLSEAFKILLKEKNQNNSELILNSYIDLYNCSQNKVKLFDAQQSDINLFVSFRFSKGISSSSNMRLISSLKKNSVSLINNWRKYNLANSGAIHPDECFEGIGLTPFRNAPV